MGNEFSDTEEKKEEATPMIIIGYCDECKKPIRQGEKYDVESTYGRTRTVIGQKIRCESCDKKVKEQRRINEHEELAYNRKKGFIIGSLVGIVAFIGMLVYVISSKVYADLWIPFVLGYALFAFVSQCFWGEFMLDFLGFFVRALKFPGLIFTLDLDGIVWFICVKLLFGIIGFIFSGIVFLFGLALSLAVSMVSFPFALVKCNNDIKALS